MSARVQAAFIVTLVLILVGAFVFDRLYPKHEVETVRIIGSNAWVERRMPEGSLRVCRIMTTGEIRCFRWVYPAYVEILTLDEEGSDVADDCRAGSECLARCIG